MQTFIYTVLQTCAHQHQQQFFREIIAEINGVKSYFQATICCPDAQWFPMIHISLFFFQWNVCKCVYSGTVFNYKFKVLYFHFMHLLTHLLVAFQITVIHALPVQ